MLEIIWRLRAEVLDEEAQVRALISAVVDLPGLNATHYDLNRKGQWRRYDLQHIVVDALTQRTQLVLMRDTNDTRDAHTRSQAMIALGKHGEQPTMIARVPNAEGIAPGLIEGWGDLYGALQLESTFITSTARRKALAQSGLDLPAIGGALAMGWSRADAPAWLNKLEHARFEGTPIAVDAYATHWCVDFGQQALAAPMLAPETAYGAALSYFNACFEEGMSAA